MAAFQNGSSAPDKAVVEISVGARAYATWCWRAYLPALATRDVRDYAVRVEPQAIAMQGDPFAQLIEREAEAGRAPDIVFVPNVATASRWIEAGYLTPLDACVARHREFGSVMDELWTTHRLQGKTWGLPIENRMTYLFFSKRNLRKLGWGEEEIDALPHAIQTGEFTLDDLVKLARQAIERDIVGQGFGFWPDIDQNMLFSLLYNTFRASVPPSVLVADLEAEQINREALLKSLRFLDQIFDQRLTFPRFADIDRRLWAAELIRQDMIASAKVLFWVAPSHDWVSWSNDFAYNVGGQAHLHEQIGYTLFPAAEAGQTGTALWVNTSFYGITSPAASGRHHQDAACALLAKTFTPTMLNRLTAMSGTFSTLDPSLNQPYRALKSQYQLETEYMWAYAQMPPPLAPQLVRSDSLLFDTIRLVEKRLLSPEDATDVIFRALQGSWTMTVTHDQ